MRLLPERSTTRNATVASAALAVAAGGLLVLLGPVVVEWPWGLRLLAVIPFVAGALAPRPGVAMAAAAVTAALVLAGVWVRGPHDECDDEGLEMPEAIVPAMQGCFDQPELNVMLYGLVAVAAGVVLVVGTVAGDWVRQWSRRA